MRAVGLAAAVAILLTALVSSVDATFKGDGEPSCWLTTRLLWNAAGGWSLPIENIHCSFQLSVLALQQVMSGPAHSRRP